MGNTRDQPDNSRDWTDNSRQKPGFAEDLPCVESIGGVRLTESEPARMPWVVETVGQCAETGRDWQRPGKQFIRVVDERSQKRDVGEVTTRQTGLRWFVDQGFPA
ncbi:hypothetical protein [Amycolatopsis sp. lyj-112]|uniref:hypothetical protein n=1 Tax=Amycolatopsis sp. lyj-112 TaxID=2789288 RepID=UPI00397E6FB8